MIMSVSISLDSKQLLTLLHYMRNRFLSFSKCSNVVLTFFYHLLFTYFPCQYVSPMLSSVSLVELAASNNLLEGSLPAELGSAVSMQRIMLSHNRISGSIPKEIGKLSHLVTLDLNSNILQGAIPVELGNCMMLSTLDLGNNRLDGKIPHELALLPLLQFLVLSNNNLSGEIPSKGSKYFQNVSIPDSIYVLHHGVYNLSYNRLSGSIPDELGRCLIIKHLLLSNNLLSGVIPRSVARLSNLTTLDLSSNLLTGGIPAEIGEECVKLQGLFLCHNQLTGSIPESLGRLSALVKLNLSSNALSGSVPPSLGGLVGLNHLDLSSNLLSNELPGALSRMGNLIGFYVQQNRLSGHIDKLFKSSVVWRVVIVNLSCNSFGGDLPSSLGILSFLTTLDLHGNGFTGEIPSDIRDLAQLEYLDLSENMFRGQIPEGVCGLTHLIFLNLSQNKLRGPVPRDGVCMNLTKGSVAGNQDLCGEIIGTRCPSPAGRRKLNVWVLAALVGGAILVSLFVVVIVLMKIKTKRSSSDDRNLLALTSTRPSPLSINLPMLEQFTLGDIRVATNNFCKDNIIGNGNTGHVYKATLTNGMQVAVKKLKSNRSFKEEDSFLVEMKTLEQVKHPNLIELLAYCSDGEDMVLVYEYMANGSLDHWLFGRSRTSTLDWGRRLKIAVCAARGLDFLHHGSGHHIIHRDLKDSNILLNEDFQAKVADFGLARFICDSQTHVSTKDAGTFGYIPPEGLNMSGKPAMSGDVYSFGVLLLVLLTGKKASTDEFPDIPNYLVGWVLSKAKDGHTVDVLDPTILDDNSMLDTLQIAVPCLSKNMKLRPTMRDVLKSLEGLQTKFAEHCCDLPVREPADGGASCSEICEV